MYPRVSRCGTAAHAVPVLSPGTKGDALWFWTNEPNRCMDWT